MGVISDITGGGSNAPAAAMPYYQQIPGVYNQYEQQWVDRGNQAYGQYSDMLSKLLNDPTGYMNKIMSQWQGSPEYNDQVAAATTSANNAGAAGGTLGTGAEQSALAGKVQQLTDADQQQYLQDATGLMTQGLNGMGNIENQGYNASQFMTQGLAQNLMDEGGLASQEAEDQDNGLMGLLSGAGGLLGKLTSGAAGAAPWYSTLFASL